MKNLVLFFALAVLISCTKEEGTSTDENCFITSVLGPGFGELKYHYNLRNQISSVENWTTNHVDNSTSLSKTISLEYNSEGQVSRIDFQYIPSGWVYRFITFEYNDDKIVTIEEFSAYQENSSYILSGRTDFNWSEANDLHLQKITYVIFSSGNPVEFIIDEINYFDNDKFNASTKIINHSNKYIAEGSLEVHFDSSLNTLTGSRITLIEILTRSYNFIPPGLNLNLSYSRFENGNEINETFVNYQLNSKGDISYIEYSGEEDYQFEFKYDCL